MDYLTKHQVDLLKQEIDVLINSKYQSENNELIRDSTLLELEKRKITPENWQKELDSLKILKITVACEPTRSNILAYGSWIKKNIGQDVIMDISIDSNIVSGAQIVWNGKYKDYSLSETTNADIQRLLN